MKQIPILLILLVYLGCQMRETTECVDRNDILVKVDLKQMLIDVRILSYDNRDNIKSKHDLIEIVRTDQNVLKYIIKYGETNIYLNPDISLWKSDDLTETEFSNIAVILRLFTNKCFGMTFDGQAKKWGSFPSNAIYNVFLPISGTTNESVEIRK